VDRHRLSSTWRELTNELLHLLSCSARVAILLGAYDLLKPGGEMYFSDVYSERRIPQSLRDDEVLYGECLSGALYWNDFLSKSNAAGFHDPRIVESRPLTIENAARQEKLGMHRFASATFRLFKLDGLEPACENCGQAVIYKGTVEHAEEAFVLDGHHVIDRRKVFPVCEDTRAMLHGTHFAPHFEFIGDFSTHFGIFGGCGTEAPMDFGDAEGSPGVCC
jgi:arsenite methyltransferase